MTALPATYYRMTLTEFLRRGFLGKPPSRNTIRRALEDRHWLGERVGRTWFLFVDERGQPIPGNAGTGNAQADALLRAWATSQ